MTVAPAVEVAGPPPAAGDRFVALDVFRGLTVCLMIVVNILGPGPVFPWLAHAPWVGFTVADWVFPSFLFAVGAAMSFTLRKTASERTFLWRTGRRAAVIFLLGYLVAWYPFVHLDAGGRLVANAVADIRVMGILQRIALCFAAAALLARYLPHTTLAPVCAAILVGYWAVLVVLGLPGESLAPFRAAATAFGAGPDFADLYHASRRSADPEALLSTVPAVVNVLAGYLAAVWLRGRADQGRAALRLLAVGAALIVLALAWSPALPLSKRIWTSSYALLAVGTDLVLIAALIAYLDGGKRRLGVGFFEVFGKNPLVIYLFSEMLIATLQLIPLDQGQDFYEYVGWRVFQTVAPGPVGSLASASAYMLVCWLVGYALKRANLVIRV